MSVSYNANNQQVGGSYDANGNTSSANGSAIGYTVENKMNSQVANTWPFGESLYGYDPWGKRVMKETNPDPQGLEGENNPLWEFYFYSIHGPAAGDHGLQQSERESDSELLGGGRERILQAEDAGVERSVRRDGPVGECAWEHARGVDGVLSLR